VTRFETCIWFCHKRGHKLRHCYSKFLMTTVNIRLTSLPKEIIKKKRKIKCFITNLKMNLIAFSVLKSCFRMSLSANWLVSWKQIMTCPVVIGNAAAAQPNIWQIWLIWYFNLNFDINIKTKYIVRAHQCP
jgi:hypothetical protein